MWKSSIWRLESSTSGEGLHTSDSCLSFLDFDSFGGELELITSDLTSFSDSSSAGSNTLSLASLKDTGFVKPKRFNEFIRFIKFTIVVKPTSFFYGRRSDIIITF